LDKIISGTYDLQQEIPLQSQGMPTATYNSYTPSKGLKIPKADYVSVI
jgi:hypothetical protein